MKKYFLFIFIIGITLLSDSSAASQLIGKFIGEQLEIYEDIHKSENQESIQKQKFYKSSERIPQFGYVDYPIWVKVKLPDNTLIEVDHSSMDLVEIYRFYQGQLRLVNRLGDSTIFKNRLFYHRNITFELQKDTTYFIKFATQSSFKLPLASWNPESFYKKSLLEYVGFSIFYALLLSFMVMNMIHFFFTSEVKYFWYSMYVGFFALTHLSVDGLAYQFLWPNCVEFKKPVSLISMTIHMVSFLFYCKFTLESYRRHKLESILNIIYYSLLAFYFVAIFIFPYHKLIGKGFLLLVIISLAMLAKSYRGYRQRINGSGYLFLACIVESLAILTYISKSQNIIPLNLFTAHVTKFLYVLQYIILNVGLTETIKEKTRKSRYFDGISVSVSHVEHEVNRIIYSYKNLVHDLEKYFVFSPLIYSQLLNISKSRAKVSSLFSKLKISNKDNFEQNNVDLDSVLSEALKTVIFIENNYEIEIVYSLEHKFFILGEYKPIVSVIVNVLENAIEDSNGKTKIFITTSNEYKKTVLKIKNTNGFISEENITKIFDERYSTKKTGQGVGLAICKKIMLGVNGEIFVNSSFQEKTVEFVLRFVSSKEERKKVDLPDVISQEVGDDIYNKLVVRVNSVVSMKIYVVGAKKMVEKLRKIIKKSEVKNSIFIEHYICNEDFLSEKNREGVCIIDIDETNIDHSIIDSPSILKILTSNRIMDSVPAGSIFVRKPISVTDILVIVNKYLDASSRKDLKSSKKIKICFIEDHVSEIQKFVNYIEEVGFILEYEVFSDPDQFIDKVEEGNKYDLLVVDRFVNKNDLLKHQVPRLAKEYGYKGKILLFSNSSISDYKELGFDYFLLKVDMRIENISSILKEI